MSPRTILITGANKGLGLEFVKQFLRLPSPPDHLFATCRDPTKAENLQELATSNPALKIFKLDVTNETEIKSVYEETKEVLSMCGLNLLINNAGLSYKKQYLGNIDKAKLIEQFDVNVFAPLLITQTFLPLLKKAAKQNKDKGLSWERAAIFNISSILGSIEENTSGGMYPYRASKAALNQVTRNLSIELERDGILAGCFHPGWVLTDLGGPNATITTEQSIQSLLQVFAKVDGTSKGQMIDFTGKLMPW